MANVPQISTKSATIGEINMKVEVTFLTLNMGSTILPIPSRT